MEGTPIRIELRSDDNPFVKSEENLNQKQVARKRRLVRNKKTESDKARHVDTASTRKTADGKPRKPPSQKARKPDSRKPAKR